MNQDSKPTGDDCRHKRTRRDHKARLVCADCGARLRVLITDPDGQPYGSGGRTYRKPRDA